MLISRARCMLGNGRMTSMMAMEECIMRQMEVDTMEDGKKAEGTEKERRLIDSTLEG